jgi:predicted nucleotidyltransferase
MVVIDLARSETRRRLLGLLFAAPEHEYHQRDLERRFGMSIGAIQHEVHKLEHEGLLKRRRLGNLVLLSLDRDHPLYAEMEAIVRKTIGIAALIANQIRALEGVRLAFIYGSYVSLFTKAGSKWSGESDVDLLVVGEIDPRAISRVGREVGSGSGRQVNYSVFSVEEMKGKISHQDSFVDEVLKKPVLPLVGFPESDYNTPLHLEPKDLQRLLN